MPHRALSQARQARPSHYRLESRDIAAFIDSSSRQDGQEASMSFFFLSSSEDSMVTLHIANRGPTAKNNSETRLAPINRPIRAGVQRCLSRLHNVFVVGFIGIP